MTMTSPFARASAALTAAACLFLSACASDGHLITLPETYAKSAWKGHPVVEAIGKWGFPPVPAEHNADGTTLYRWFGQANYTYDQQVGHVEDSYGGATLYKTQVGHGGCQLLITADANGIITSLDTTQEVRGCTNALFSTGFAPTAQNAADGKLIAQQIKSVRVIDARFLAVCTDPQYASMFNQSNCKQGIIMYPAHGTMAMPERKKLLAWLNEMNAVSDDYQAFFLNNGNRKDSTWMRFNMAQENANTVSAPPPKQDDGPAMLEDRFPTRLVAAALKAQQRVMAFATHSEQTYHQLSQ